MNLLLLVAAGVLCATAVARADGAFPGENAVLLPPASNLLYVDSNFGLLSSANAGADWYYVCEAAVAPNGGNVLHYLLGGDGTLFAVSADQFSVSTDGGVHWLQGAGSIANQELLDAFVDPTDSSFVVVIGTASGNQTALYPSTDGGKTFGEALLIDPGELLSVEISQSTSGLLYATAWEPTGTSGQALLYSSPDHGKTWTKTPVTSFAGQALMIAAVDPADGQTVYYRATAPPGLAVTDDQLATTTNGGATLTQALDLGEAMGAFARGDDGTLYVGGSGTAGGLWVLPPSATTWSTVMTPPITCLGLRGETLYACSQGINGTFALGSSTNGGQSFTSIFDFSNIIGPLPCDPVQSGCAASWQQLLGTFGTYIGTNPPAHPVAVTCPGDSMPAAKKGCSCTGLGDTAGVLLAGLAMLGRRKRTAL